MKARNRVANPRSGLSKFLLASVAALCATPEVLAQAPAPNPDQNAKSSAGQSNEVVVTARRREERLQDVPVAVTSISADKLENAGIESSKQLTQVVPGLNFTQSVYSPQPTIRGIGTRGVGNGDESVVPVYINGVYQPNLQTLDFQLNNIQRIEVLRGPQSTLFGRNATAGAINIITKTPHAGFSGNASVSYGRFNETIAKLYMTGGTDTLAGDIAVMSAKDDGYIHDIVHNAEIASKDDFAVRTSLRWTPTDFTDWTLSLGYANNADTTGSANQPINGNSAARYFDANLPASLPPYTTALGELPYNKLRQYSVSLNGRVSFDKFDLHSVTGWQNNLFKARADSDSLDYLASLLYVHQWSRDWYQEVYATSKNEGPFSWIGGLVYFQDASGTNPFDYPANIYFRSATSGAVTTSATYSYLTTKSIAGYLEGTYKFGDHWSATLGARYTQDKKTLFTQTILPALTAPASLEATFERFTPAGTLTYKVNNDLNFYFRGGSAFKAGLISVVTGLGVVPVEPEDVTQFELGMKSQPFRGATFNVSLYHTDYKGLQTLTRDASGGGLLLNADAEIYGLEVEGSLRPIDNLNLRYGISALHGEYTDFPGAQNSIPRPPTGANSCASSPFSGPGNVITYPCGDYTGPFLNAAGNDIIRAPRFQANFGADYTVPLEYGSLMFTGNFSYSSSSYWDPANRVKEPIHRLLNGEVTWTDPDKRYSIGIWGENLLDQKYFLTRVISSSDSQVYARPISYGVRVGYNW